MPLLIFDLDGTLIDSKLDLVHAVNRTRAEMGKGPLPHDLIFSYVGNGAPVLIQRAMGPETSEEQVREALEFFLAYYREHAVVHTVLYPGVLEGLRSLHAAGATLAVLTNKPVRISKMILDHFGIGPLLLQVYGGNSFDRKKPDPVGIETLRVEAGAASDETWMVGDSYVDILTARNAGVKSCGVTYGFQPESLKELPPDLLVDRFKDFAARFL